MDEIEDEDGLRMKNFNIMRVHRKIRFLGGAVTKNQYIGGNCLKRGGGFGHLTDLRVRGDSQKRGKGEGGLIPQCTLCHHRGGNQA